MKPEPTDDPTTEDVVDAVLDKLGEVIGMITAGGTIADEAQSPHERRVLDAIREAFAWTTMDAMRREGES